MAAAAVGLAAVGGSQDGRGRDGRQEAVGHLALLPGVHGLHREPPAHRHPALDELILDLISLDYHEALMVPSGHLAEKSRRQAMEAHAGEYILVTEGAIPTKDGGIYCQIGGHTALDIVREAAEIGRRHHRHRLLRLVGRHPLRRSRTRRARRARRRSSRARPSSRFRAARPIPTTSSARRCSTRPSGRCRRSTSWAGRKFAYGRTIHEHCPRRAHFDAGRFAEKFGDEGHREGWCLYRLGCKGPVTHANCSTQHFGEVVDAWPIGLGHPCFGCTEQRTAFRVALHDTVDVERPANPDTYPPIAAPGGKVGAWATGVGGLIGGAVLGAGYKASKSLDKEGAEPEGEG